MSSSLFSHVQYIVSGKNIRLYDMVLQFLRTLFLKTHNVHYCSLRAEILMALHDLEVSYSVALS